MFEQFERRTRPPGLVLVLLGLLPLLATVVFACRIIWEETFLTWRQGPQMVGFSLGHGEYAFLFLAPLVMTIYLLLAWGRTIFLWIKARKVPRLAVSFCILGTLLMILLSLPEGAWEYAFAGTFARSPRANEIVVYACYMEAPRLVRKLIDDGVPVTSTDYEGDTPLHAAAATGDIKLMSFLVEQHANVNVLNGNGDSPAQRAFANHQPEAAQWLLDHGGQRVEGTPEQREQNAERVVRQSMHGP